MKILADENMPMVAELFASHGEVHLMPGRLISPDQVADTDILLVRSVTPVNQQLLANSRVRFVGSATIGSDHLDLNWLAQQGIAVASAPGCNAAAVGDYVVAALSACEPNWQRKTIAIVGCGNTGGGLYGRLKALGVECRCFDPFLSRQQIPDLTSFDAVLEADIVCLHTPLTRRGLHPTWHLFDDEVLGRLVGNALLLNAGRGEVIDNRALLARLERGQLRAILDVWEGEPDIDLALLERVVLGTPHIAGYSLEGRLRGTLMVYNAFCRWSGNDGSLDLDSVLERMGGGAGQCGSVELNGNSTLPSVVLSAYDPRRDHHHMAAAFATSGASTKGVFDHLRKTYPPRREFSHFVPCGNIAPPLAEQLQALGFNPAKRTDH
jgi:erythronate-4-phosphate dehydrogenase